jgi:hypothetical protein
VVRIKSGTGTIHVRFDKLAISNGRTESKSNEKGVLQRVYNTKIDATTGQIYAELLHGGEGGQTILNTRTGSLDLRATPIGDEPSRIETSAMTGLSRVVVEAPMRGTTLKNLTALHTSRSTGMVDVKYPRVWEGRVHAWCTGPGSVNVRGEGLNIQGGGSNVYAWRGKDASENGKIVEVVSKGTGMVIFAA